MRSAAGISEAIAREESVPSRRGREAVPIAVNAVGSSANSDADDSAATALRTASRAVAIAENLREGVTKASPARENRRGRPSGDYDQAVVDGAVAQACTRLERRIRAHLPKGSLSVTLTDNRYTMISVRREGRRGPRYQVRLHHMFSDADPAITRALARYIAKNDRRSSRMLGLFIDDNQHRVRSRNRRQSNPKLTTAGNSVGVVLPKEALARMRAKKGDILYLVETKQGYSLTPYDQEFSEQMEAADDVMRRYRNALRELAK